MLQGRGVLGTEPLDPCSTHNGISRSAPCGPRSAWVSSAEIVAKVQSLMKSGEDHYAVVGQDMLISEPSGRTSPRIVFLLFTHESGADINTAGPGREGQKNILVEFIEVLLFCLETRKIESISSTLA